MNAYNYVRTLRKRNALTEIELGNLLGGISRQAVSHFEYGTSLPSLHTALALEIVFGVPLSKLFPHLHEKIENQVLADARSLAKSLEELTDKVSGQKRLLLSDIVKRSKQKPA